MQPDDPGGEPYVSLWYKNQATTPTLCGPDHDSYCLVGNDFVAAGDNPDDKFCVTGQPREAGKEKQVPNACRIEGTKAEREVKLAEFEANKKNEKKGKQTEGKNAKGEPLTKVQLQHERRMLNTVSLQSVSSSVKIDTLASSETLFVQPTIPGQQRPEVRLRIAYYTPSWKCELSLLKL